MDTNYLRQTYGERFFEFPKALDFSKEFERRREAVCDIKDTMINFVF